jgi:type III secretion protein I
MDISVSAAAASLIAQAQNTPLMVKTLPAVGAGVDLASAQFAQIMSKPPPQTGSTSTDPASAAQALSKSSQPDELNLAITPPTMGDSILNGLQNMSSQFKQQITQIEAGLDSMGSGKASISDLLRLQAGMLQVSVQYELIGKVVSKSTQNLDSLLKLQ